MQSSLVAVRQLLGIVLGLAALTAFLVAFRLVVVGAALDLPSPRHQAAFVFLLLLESLFSPAALFFIPVVGRLALKAQGLRTRDGQVGMLLALAASLGASWLCRGVMRGDPMGSELLTAAAGAGTLYAVGWLVLAHAGQEGPEKPRVLAGSREGSYEEMKQLAYREEDDW
jgi:hypothetical protein